MENTIKKLLKVINEAGYNWSKGMSNNAVDAYEKGIMPLSKWNKKLILEKIAEFYPNILDIAKSTSLSVLKSVFLYKSEWHHTSKYYNVTDFYAFDEDLDESDIRADIEEIINKRYFIWDLLNGKIIQKDLTLKQASALAKTKSAYHIKDMKDINYYISE